MKEMVSQVKVNDRLKVENDQVLYTNIMVIDGKKCLIAICEPLQLTPQTLVEREHVDILGTALQG